MRRCGAFPTTSGICGTARSPIRKGWEINLRMFLNGRDWRNLGIGLMRICCPSVGSVRHPDGGRRGTRGFPMMSSAPWLRCGVCFRRL